MTHYQTTISKWEEIVRRTYTLGLEVSPSQAVVMLIEVHHLEAIELCRNIFDLLLLLRLSLLDAFSVPSDVFRHDCKFQEREVS